MNSGSVPEISPREVFNKLHSKENFILLDVREHPEITRAKLQDPRVEYAPMSELANQSVSALPEPARDPEAEIVVFCHQGVRSAQVTLWLKAQGWNHVRSMRGGIDAYAREIDPNIGFY